LRLLNKEIKLRGHTLVEMLVVLILVSITAMICFDLLGKVLNRYYRVNREIQINGVPELIFLLKLDFAEARLARMEGNIISLVKITDTITYELSQNSIRRTGNKTNEFYIQNIIYDYKIIEHLNNPLSFKLKIHEPMNIHINLSLLPSAKRAFDENIPDF